MQFIPGTKPILAGSGLAGLPRLAHSVFPQRVDNAGIIDRASKGMEFWRPGLPFSVALDYTKTGD